MKVIVVNAPSGVALTAVTDAISSELGGSPAVAIADVEAELLSLFRSDYPLAEVTAAGPMQDVLAKLPRDAVTQYYWPRAAVTALTKLLTSNASVRLLRCHLTYYRDATREFYAAGDIHRAIVQAATEITAQTDNANLRTALADVTISSVITLIDDVYDMFHRLAVADQVYPLQSYITSEYRRRKHEGRSLPVDPSEQYVLAFEQVITILHRLLEWRSREMTSGDVLAARASAEHYVLAIKHAKQTAVNLIRLGNGDDSYVPVYLSHPISRPRKQQKSDPSKEWGAFVTEFQEFVEAASELVIDSRRPIFFMPTAIDEYRFADRAAAEFPTLERRWPLIEDDTGLLYDTPGGLTYDAFEEDQLLEELLNPVGGAFNADGERLAKFADSYRDVPGRLSVPAKDSIHGLIAGFLQQIRIQLSIRDHALVRQTGRLLLYRPLFGEGRLSGGVEGELHNWSTLVQTASWFTSHGRPVTWRTGPAVFVHDAKDLENLEKLMWQRMKTNLMQRLAVELPPAQFEAFAFDRMTGKTSEWFSQALKPPDELLGGAPLTPAELKALEGKFTGAIKEVARESRQIVFVGAAGPQSTYGKHFFRYPRLAERTFNALQKLARRDIIPRLLGDVGSCSTCCR